VSEAQLLLKELSCTVLGFSLENVPNSSVEVSLVQLQKLVDDFGLSINVSSVNQTIDALVEYRESTRKDKNFALADSIRDELLGLRIALDDSADGTTWTALIH
jgi:cysteinyl-tRNA synthetase